MAQSQGDLRPGLNSTFGLTGNVHNWRERPLQLENACQQYIDTYEWRCDECYGIHVRDGTLMRSNHSVVKPILQLVRRVFHRLPAIRWRRFAARRSKLPERDPLQYAWFWAWNSRFAAVRHASPCSKATTSYFTVDHFRMLRGHHTHPSYIGYACLSQCQPVNLLEYVTVRCKILFGLPILHLFARNMEKSIFGPFAEISTAHINRDRFTSPIKCI